MKSNLLNVENSLKLLLEKKMQDDEANLPMNDSPFIHIFQIAGQFLYSVVNFSVGAIKFVQVSQVVLEKWNIFGVKDASITTKPV